MNKNFLDIFLSWKLFKIFVLILLASVFALWIGSFVYPYIGRDGSYYLSVGRDIVSQGVGFYKINVQYNPMGMYIYGLPNLIKEQTLELTLILMLIFNLLNMFLFDKILGLLLIDKAIRIFSVTIFIFYFSFLGGTYVYLEIFTLFFILLTVIFFLKEKYFVTGSLLFLAFYTKQYALSLSIPILVYSYLNVNNKVFFKRIFILSSGFIILLVLAYIAHKDQVDIVTFLKRLIAQNNTEGRLKQTGNNNILNSIKDFLKVFGFYLFLPFSIFLVIKNKLKSKYSGFFILVFLCSILSLFFAQFVYYYLLIFPWLIILLAINLNENSLNPGLTFLFRGILIVSIISTLYVFKILQGKKTNYKNTMSSVSKAIKFVPRNSNVYLYTDETLYYYAPYFSSNHEKIGYSFPKGRSIDYFNGYMDSGSYVIISNKQFKINSDSFTYDFKFLGSDEKNTYLLKN